MTRSHTYSGLFALSLTLALTVLFLGCGVGDSINGGVNPGGGLGATPGGAQDFSYVRELIEQGRVPQEDNILAEGLLSEYDLPIDGPAPDQLLTLRTCAGFGGDTLVPGSGAWVQLGMASNIDPETFHRPSLNLSIILDKSGSMSGAKIQRAKRAVQNIIRQLDEDDFVSVVLFNQSMSVLFAPQPATNLDALCDQVGMVEAGGRTNMEAGMIQGYSYVRQNLDAQSERGNRVMLITDAMANVGNTSPDGFAGIVTNGADDGIYLTAIGVGIDFDQEMVEFFATEKGANYYYFNSDEEADSLVANEFEFMVTPIAFDLTITVTPSASVTLQQVIGFPGEDPMSPQMTVKSIYLSRRRGAMLFRFTPTATSGTLLSSGATVADMSLAYETVDGQAMSNDLSAVYNGPDITGTGDHHLDESCLRLAVALARETEGMKRACGIFWDGWDSRTGLVDSTVVVTADSIATLTLNYLQAENDALGDNILGNEISLMQRFIENMQP